MIESVLNTSMSKKGVYYISDDPETSEFTKTPGSHKFCGLAGRAPNWTGRALKQFLYERSYP